MRASFCMNEDRHVTSNIQRVGGLCGPHRKWGFRLGEGRIWAHLGIVKGQLVLGALKNAFTAGGRAGGGRERGKKGGKVKTQAKISLH